jgi:Glycosyl transferase family 2
VIRQTVTVIVPSYRRPALLKRCLTALEHQIRAPDEMIVVLRAGDRESRAVTDRQSSTSLTVLEVDQPGVLAAMRIGVARSSGEIVAFTDDDAEPSPEWLERILALLAQAGIGAAGGRDVIPGQTEPRLRDVGRRTPFGKHVGNHHLGFGSVRDVDVLKGVNMAFRAECLALPAPGVLSGDGAEVHFELLCSRWAQKRGWRIAYDPAVEVAHAGAERIGLDRRSRPASVAVQDAAYNFVIATSALDRRRLPVQTLYALALGSKDAPGIGRAVLAATRGEREVIRRFIPSFKGAFFATVRLAANMRGPIMVACDDLRGTEPPLRTDVA